jgi:hypothetical protein
MRMPEDLATHQAPALTIMLAQVTVGEAITNRMRTLADLGASVGWF